MIQRIQTVWLLAVIILLLVVSLSGDFFVYVTDHYFYHFNAQGVVQKTLDNKQIVKKQSIPVIVLTVGMAAFAMYVMLLFKKLNKQFSLVRVLWGLYVFLLFGVVFWNFYIAKGMVEGEIFRSNFGANFYLLVIGLPLVHLAMINIGKDKKKIDSLHRLR